VELKLLNIIAKAVQSLQGDNVMPMVGNKKFSYDAKGKQMAKNYAKKTGMEMKTQYKMGGGKTKPMYASSGTYVGDAGYKSCGANIKRTK